MKIVKIKEQAGVFAENKDIAKSLRIETILPAIKKEELVQLDFKGVTGTTQSFIHALISEPLRQFGDTALDYIEFKNCNEVVQQIIIIVTEYMQEARQ